MVELRERSETRRAVERMLILISEICGFLCEKTSQGIFGMSSSSFTLFVSVLICSAGNLIGNEYQEKVNDLKTEFEKAKESFDRSIRLEIFKAIRGIGEHTTFSLDLDAGKY